MLERLSPAKRNAALLILAAVVCWFLWSIRAVLNPLFVGYLCAYILHPMVVRLEKRGRSRRSAVNRIFVFGFLGMGVLVIGVLMQSKRLVVDVLENREAWELAEAKLEAFGTRADELLAPVADLLGEELVEGPEAPPQQEAAAEPEEATGSVEGEAHEPSSVERIARNLWQVDSVAEGTSRVGLGALGGMVAMFFGLFGSVFELVSLLVLLPLYTYYLLFELESIHAFIRRYLPISDRERLARMATKMGEMLASFFHGRLLVCLLKGGVITIGLWIAGVDYALLFGMGSGFLSLVPVLGPAMGFVFACVVAVLEHGVVGALVRTGIVFGIAELLEGYVFLPKMLGDRLNLPEVAVLFALLAGGNAFGLFGVVIALPLAAALVIVAQELVLPALRDFADES